MAILTCPHCGSEGKFKIRGLRTITLNANRCIHLTWSNHVARIKCLQCGAVGDLTSFFDEDAEEEAVEEKDTVEEYETSWTESRHYPVLRLLEQGLNRVRQNWCQYDLARDRNNRSVDPSSRKAIAWSMYGALLARLDGRAVAKDHVQQAHAWLRQAAGNYYPHIDQVGSSMNRKRPMTRARAVRLYEYAIFLCKNAIKRDQRYAVERSDY